jgi:hypothetical protein
MYRPRLLYPFEEFGVRIRLDGVEGLDARETGLPEIALG